MKAFACLYPKVYSFKSLYSAFLKARKYKAQAKDAIEFEYRLEKNLFKLQDELKNLTYRPQRPKRIKTFKPAKRVISVPAFKDRVAQQALLAIIGPLFEKGFIFDSYAFRIGKSVHKALKRFDCFRRKVAPKRFPNSGFILKADIRNYYPEVNHTILIRLIKERIKDAEIIRLVKTFLKNQAQSNKGISTGAPLSQLFANIYLNKLDYYVKHTLKQEFYLRYCDDFMILKKKSRPLEEAKAKIERFLKERLCLSLNQDKTKIARTNKGVDFLGYKVFYFYKLIRKRNLNAFKERLLVWQRQLREKRISAKDITLRIRGWVEYARYADSYKIRKKLFKKFN